MPRSGVVNAPNLLSATATSSATPRNMGRTRPHIQHLRPAAAVSGAPEPPSPGRLYDWTERPPTASSVLAGTLVTCGETLKAARVARPLAWVLLPVLITDE